VNPQQVMHIDKIWIRLIQNMIVKNLTGISLHTRLCVYKKRIRETTKNKDIGCLLSSNEWNSVEPQITL